MSGRCPRRGLYAITREGYASPAALAAAVAAAIRGGAVVIQYRAKTAVDSQAEAAALLAVCRAAGVPLLINDDMALALRIDADGVHLGRDDGDPETARRLLGPDAIIGVSCYDSVDLARRAAAQGADYVAFGRFFPSQTKPHAPCARLDTLIQARRELAIPLVAIGGITAANGGELVRAGADMLAVIEGVFGAEDPETAAQMFTGLFTQG